MLAASSTQACSAAAVDDVDQASQNITTGPNSEGGACFSDDEQAYPYQEGGACWELYGRALEDEYKTWTTVVEGGHTLAEQAGCQPSSPSHPAAEGLPLCPSYTAGFVDTKCLSYAHKFKTSTAAAAIRCLTKLSDLTDAEAVYTCGFEALDQACYFHPTAEAACAELATTLENRGLPHSEGERVACNRWLSGLRAEGRAAILQRASRGSWYGLYSAIEGL
jgi:hypothetical protein